MIALDTNVLVRFLVNDDAQQATIATELINHPGGVFIAKTVLLELEWVLRYVFAIEQKAVHIGLINLLGLPNVTVESISQIERAMQDYAAGMDFADALHLAASDESMKIYTFDQKFAKLGTPKRVVLATRTNKSAHS